MLLLLIVSGGLPRFVYAAADLLWFLESVVVFGGVCLCLVALDIIIGDPQLGILKKEKKTHKDGPRT